jgi:hypothetical protein
MRIRWFLVLALAGWLALPAAAQVPPPGPPPPAPAGPFQVPGEVALASLASLGDAHLFKLADSLETLAATAEARTGRWAKLRGPLAAVGEDNVEALLWFATPDGAYWSVARGREHGNLSSREYFPRVLRGERVVGALVVSKSTGRSSGIVAVPVLGPNRKVRGVLGASVYLDRLGERLRQEMDLPAEFIFYSFDATPIVALDWDPSLVLADPARLGPDVLRAFREMLGHDRGVVRYEFRGQPRTVIYRRSKVSGWWYALGTVAGGKPVR